MRECSHFIARGMPRASLCAMPPPVIGTVQVVYERTDGAAWCWGRNSSGQLGNGDTAASLVPVLVTNPNP